MAKPRRNQTAIKIKIDGKGWSKKAKAAALKKKYEQMTVSALQEAGKKKKPKGRKK